MVRFRWWPAPGFPERAHDAVQALEVLRRTQGALRHSVRLPPRDESTVRRLAEASAARHAAGRALGPLDGLPLHVKDNLAGGAASRALPISDTDRDTQWAWAVRQLVEQAGMVAVGLGNMDEFGMGSDGRHAPGWLGAARNPHAPRDRSAGGSSGGVASAVAAGCCAVGLGSDTGGSVRQPAASCGLWGFKPAYGAVSRAGLTAYASSLDCVGWMARDARLLREVGRVLLAGSDPLDATHRPPLPSPSPSPPPSPSPLGVVGVPREYAFEELGEEARLAWELTLRELRRRGCRTVEVSLPHTRLALPAYYVIACAEASSNLSRYDGSHFGSALSGWDPQDPEADMDFRTFEELNRTRSFGPEVLRRILTGTSVLSVDSYDRFFKQAQIVRHLVARDFWDCFASGVDVVLTPVSPQPALPLCDPPEGTELGWDALRPETKGKEEGAASVAQGYEYDCCTVPASLAGLPALSAPVYSEELARRSSPALPLAVQLIGPPGGDMQLLDAACWLQDRECG